MDDATSPERGVKVPGTFARKDKDRPVALLGVLRTSGEKGDKVTMDGEPLPIPQERWTVLLEALRADGFKGARRKAGRYDGKGARMHPDFELESFLHDLRRSAVRNLRREGVPESVAMKISGHKTNAVFRRYDIVDSSDFHAAMKAVDKAAKAQKPANAENG